MHSAITLLYYAFKRFSSNYAEESARYARMPRQKKFTVGGGEQLVRVLFYTLLVFDSLQFSVDCPTAPALPARRVSRKLTLFARNQKA